LPPRIYLTGRVTLENESVLVDERDLAGRQGRLAFVYLAAGRDRTATRDELISVIWRDGPPPELDAALNAVLSKLRAAFRKAGLSSEAAGIDVRLGSISLRLPSEAWIDIEDACNATDEAEGALRAGALARAWGCANVVVSIARRPFLPDEEASWIESRRASLRGLLTRGLRCLAHVSARNGEPALALQYAGEIVELEPFQESGYRELMQLHAGMGNRAEALRVFGRCRELLRDELGASPSPETEALFLKILQT
jgi:SARP family transcriptional regulator, regulator of embCAB operon